MPKKTEHSGHSLISFIFNNEAVWVVKSCMIEMCSLQENNLQSQRFQRDVPLQNLLMNDRFHRPYLVSFRTLIVVIFKIFHGHTAIVLYEHTFSHLRTTTRTATDSDGKAAVRCWSAEFIAAAAQVPCPGMSPSGPGQWLAGKQLKATGRFRRDVPLQNLLTNDHFQVPHFVSLRMLIVVSYKISKHVNARPSIFHGTGPWRVI